MALPDASLDAALSYGFIVTIDGVQIPSVISVSELRSEVESVQYSEQTSSGKFVNRQLAGKNKGGEFTVTRGMTDSKTVAQWLTQIVNGDMKSARKTAEVAITDYQGSPIRRFSFQNCWVKSVAMGQLEAGGTNVLTETFTISFDEMKVE